jgi:hypothetical protein
MIKIKRVCSILLLTAMPLLFSGCGLFKKKCDCPGFGQKSQLPATVAANAVSPDRQN